MQKLMFSLILMSPLFAGEEPLAPLQRMAGDWKLTFLQIDQDGVYQEVGRSASHIEVKLDGRLVQEEVVIKTASSEYPLVVVYSYDSIRQVYRKASTDGVTGLMDIQEGQLTNGVLHLSNTHSETWFVGPSGKELAFSLYYDFNDPNRMVLTAELSIDHGKSWEKFQRVIYERATSQRGH